MPTSAHGWQQASNGQAAVDMDSHLIVGGRLSQAPNDKQQLQPTLDTLDKLPETIGQAENITVDNGYFSEDNVNEAAVRELTPYLAAGRRKATVETIFGVTKQVTGFRQSSVVSTFKCWIRRT